MFKHRQPFRSKIPIVRRLYQESQAPKRCIDQIHNEREQKELQECIFAPQINDISRAVVEDGAFFKRQALAQQKRMMYAELQQLGLLTDEECTFCPNVKKDVVGAQQRAGGAEVV
ncbi:MAG: hypothetical protein EZS28_037063, partial [Streblomastix strix]